MTKTLTVRNPEQAAAWLELDGQISDGMWENTRPYDHYRVWCQAEVVVAGPTIDEQKQIGRNFYANKSNYDFCSKKLLDVVGLRMLGIVRIAREVGIKSATILEHAVSCKTGMIDWAASWNQGHVNELTKLGVTLDSIDQALANESYTMRDLRRDLNDLKIIIKIDNRSYAPQAPVAR